MGRDCDAPIIADAAGCVNTDPLNIGDHLLTVCLRLLLQSVAFAAQVKTLQEQNAEMEKKISELKLQLEVTPVSLTRLIDLQNLFFRNVKLCLLCIEMIETVKI